MAPELSLGQPYDRSVDNFAYGILFFIILSGKFAPYAAVDRNGIKTTPNMIQMRVATDCNFRPNLSFLPSNKDNEWVSAICKLCWRNSPAERPSFSLIVKMLRSRRIIEEATVGATRNDDEKTFSVDSLRRQEDMKSQETTESEQKGLVEEGTDKWERKIQEREDELNAEWKQKIKDLSKSSTQEMDDLNKKWQAKVDALNMEWEERLKVALSSRGSEPVAK